MNDKDELICPEEAGFVYEHNASIIEITLNEEFASEDYDYLALAFDVSGLNRKIVSNNIYPEETSAAYRKANKVYCPLTQGLTRSGIIGVQLEAHVVDASGAGVIRKSSVATLCFAPSITGAASEIDSNTTLVDQMRAAVEFINMFEETGNHVHKNMDLLESLSAEDGRVYFGSEPVGAKSYTELTDKPDIPDRTSALENDSNFVADADYVHTDNNFSREDKEKLSGIEQGAQRNVQSDWGQTDEEAADFIKNKPPTITGFTGGKNIDVTQDGKIHFVLSSRYYTMRPDEEPDAYKGFVNAITENVIFGTQDVSGFIPEDALILRIIFHNDANGKSNTVTDLYEWLPYFYHNSFDTNMVITNLPTTTRQTFGGFREPVNSSLHDYFSTPSFKGFTIFYLEEVGYELEW